MNKRVESSAVTEGKYSGISVFTPGPRLNGLKSTGFCIAFIAKTQFLIILSILTIYRLSASGDDLYFLAFFKQFS